MHPSNPAPLLPWTLRLVGALLAVCSVFFLIKNLGFGIVDDAFCAICLGLGVMTFSAGCLPESTQEESVATLFPNAA